MVYYKGKALQLGCPRSCLVEIAQTLGSLGTSEPFCDVAIHCRNKVKVSANKYLLSQRSKLLKLAFDADNSGDSVLLCPDFDSEPMTAVLGLISRGLVSVVSEPIYNSMMTILKVLEIEIEISTISFQSPALTNGNFTALPISEDESKDTANGRNSIDEISVSPDTENHDKDVNLEFHIPRVNLPSEDQDSGLSETNHDDIAEADDETAAVPEIAEKDDPDSRTDVGVGSSGSVGVEMAGPSDISEKREAKPITACNICDICGRKFNTTFALNRHRTRHCEPAKEKPVAPEDANDDEITSKRIQRKPNVTIELLSGESSVEAEHADASNVESRQDSELGDAILESTSELVLHRSDGKLVFSCKMCGKNASSLGNLMMHLTGHFKSRILKMNENNTKICVSCNRNFGNTAALLYHIARVHKVLQNLLTDFTDGLPATSDKKKKRKTRQKLPAKQQHQELPLNERSQQRLRQEKPEPHPRKTGKQSSGGGSMYQCPKCKVRLRTYRLMLYHIGISHYSDYTELESMLPKDSTKCPHCDRDYQKAYNLRTHIVVKHDALKDLIPSKRDLQVLNPVTGFQCHLCPKQFLNRLKFLMHIAVRHFRDELIGKYLADGGCGLCHKKCTDQNFLSHLIINHEVVDDVIPGQKK